MQRTLWWLFKKANEICSLREPFLKFEQYYILSALFHEKTTCLSAFHTAHTFFFKSREIVAYNGIQVYKGSDKIQLQPQCHIGIMDPFLRNVNLIPPSHTFIRDHMALCVP